MNILINASNLGKGGGMQVADSICCSLSSYTQHSFVVVVSKAMKKTLERIKDYSNIKSFEYSFPAKDLKSLLCGRNDFLDSLVELYSIDCVLSVFGPITWHPRCAHVCGFAIPHLVIPESPYFQRLKGKQLLRMKLWIWFNIQKFRNGTKFLFSENPYISQRIKKMIPDAEVRTITNTYNQVFDNPNCQKLKKLPTFDGFTILTVSAAYPHKNLGIAIDILNIWENQYPNVKIRFVFTIDSVDFPKIPSKFKNYILTIGKVDISEVPSLYEQCDIVMQPSLLECFSAIYVEAMRMRRPMIVTDLAFAKGLCVDAAVYYEATSAYDASVKLYNLILDEELQKHLIEKGSVHLASFDTNKTRVDKLISYCEEVAFHK